MTADATGPGTLTVTLVWSPGARAIESVALHLPPGSTVHAALNASGKEWGVAPSVGVWGRKVALDHVLREGDRLEVYRPLIVDPKRARRERFSRQGARTAGLFAKRATPGKKSA